jgi:hypothetical protein
MHAHYNAVVLLLMTALAGAAAKYENCVLPGYIFKPDMQPSKVYRSEQKLPSLNGSPSWGEIIASYWNTCNDYEGCLAFNADGWWYYLLIFHKPFISEHLMALLYHENRARVTRVTPYYVRLHPILCATGNAYIGRGAARPTFQPQY